jgi:lysophospholipase L1-like esterase
MLSEIFLRIFLPQIFEIHPPGMYTADPEAGYVLTPGFHGTIKRAEFEITFQVGPSGLRGKEPESRRSNTYRILTLGDSQAFGFGVTDKETFAYQLEAKLQKQYPDINVQVLNAGVPGYGTADQFAFLELRGKALKPDLVIVQFLSVNDIEESRYPATTWADVRGGMLANTSAEQAPAQFLPWWRRLQDWLKNNIHLARLLSDRLGYLAMKWGILGNKDGFWGEDFTAEEAELTANYLVAISAASRKLNAECLFLYTTGQVHVFSDKPVMLKSAGFMEAAARKANVAWINSLDFLRRRPDKFNLYYPQDGHWTAAGHRAIAQILFDYIVEHELIPITKSSPEDN